MHNKLRSIFTYRHAQKMGMQLESFLYANITEIWVLQQQKQ